MMEIEANKTNTYLIKKKQGNKNKNIRKNK